MEITQKILQHNYNSVVKVFCFLENRSVFNEGEKSMYDEKTREKLIRETAESIYQYYPMACKMVI